MTDYTERLKACKNWRWVMGMVCDDGDGYKWHVIARAVSVDLLVCCYIHGVFYTRPIGGNDTPDLTDPATQGCLEAQVENAGFELRIRRPTDRDILRGGGPVGNMWDVINPEQEIIDCVGSKAKAILAALEAM